MKKTITIILFLTQASVIFAQFPKADSISFISSSTKVSDFQVDLTRDLPYRKVEVESQDSKQDYGLWKRIISITRKNKEIASSVVFFTPTIDSLVLFSKTYFLWDDSTSILFKNDSILSLYNYLFINKFSKTPMYKNHVMQEFELNKQYYGLLGLMCGENGSTTEEVSKVLELINQKDTLSISDYLFSINPIYSTCGYLAFKYLEAEGLVKTPSKYKNRLSFVGRGVEVIWCEGCIISGTTTPEEIWGNGFFVIYD